MDSIDDIRYAVRSEDDGDEIIAFFAKQDDAETFAENKGGEPEGYSVLSRNDSDFYIDIQVETSTSFDIRA